ncbi:MAG: hypothetical protein GY749_26870 [Desulfobacteraceae bacterium]|nr:hypothetical protein [Desulfobacteraceae bacterium]
MKRKLFFTVVVALVMIGTGTSFADQICAGDADQNGTINYDDVYYITTYIVGIHEYPIELSLADADGSCEIDIDDALIIAQYLEGYDVQLHCIESEWDIISRPFKAIDTYWEFEEVCYDVQGYIYCLKPPGNCESIHYIDSNGDVKTDLECYRYAYYYNDCN